MVNPPCPRSAIPATNLPDLQVFKILLSIRSAYIFELGTPKKVAVPQWLISATPPEFNHLRPMRTVLRSHQFLARLILHNVARDRAGRDR